MTEPLQQTGERPAPGALHEETGQSASIQDLPPGSPPDDAVRYALSSGLIHDLRTPLNQILGYSEMLAEQEQEEGREGFVSDLHKIRAAGRQLLALIDDRFQQIESPAPNKAKGERRKARAPIPKTQYPTPNTSVPQYPTPASLLPTPHRAEGRSVSDASQGSLLVVDDNETNRDMLSRRLEQQGYGVAMASNGYKALEAMRTQSFDLVLLDIMMPEMDGYEVLSRLKADETLRHIPVLMISALSEMDAVVRCIEMGAEDYLLKPFDPTLLRARIGACLEKKRGHDREMRLFEELQQNYQRLQELEKLRDDLMSMIIHDLRTPLSSVIMGVQALELAGDLNEMQQELAGIAVSGGETLLGMINELLDVDKMESGALKLDYALLSPVELVASAVRQVAPLVEGKGLTLVQRISADLPPFQGDENTLRRTLVNLLGNAIKFTPASGVVTVGAQQGEDGQSLLFYVSDTGEGIPREAFGRIFEKFGQVESREGGRVRSTGLGLTFCKLAVEAHGGRIEVESLPGKGSTFSFAVSTALFAGRLP